MSSWSVDTAHQATQRQIRSTHPPHLVVLATNNPNSNRKNLIKWDGKKGKIITTWNRRFRWYIVEQQKKIRIGTRIYSICQAHMAPNYLDLIFFILFFAAIPRSCEPFNFSYLLPIARTSNRKGRGLFSFLFYFLRCAQKNCCVLIQIPIYVYLCCTCCNAHGRIYDTNFSKNKKKN